MRYMIVFSHFYSPSSRFVKREWGKLWTESQVQEFGALFDIAKGIHSFRTEKLLAKVVC